MAWHSTSGLGPTCRSTAAAERTRDITAEAGGREAWVRRLTAEALGTLALVFVAAGADAAAKLSAGEVSAAARAVAPGLLVMAMIYALGDASGAHFNPVVSLAFALKRLFPWSWLVPYWAAQLAGALLGALILRAMFGEAAAAGISRPVLVGSGTALAIETILTAILVTVILGTADRHRLIGPNAALAVGATIALCGLVALPLEGASMNPARSFGPAVVGGSLGDLWIYWIGPVVGAVIAVVVTTLVHGAPEPDGPPLEAAQGNPTADGDDAS
jgi:MIP family channel proteins